MNSDPSLHSAKSVIQRKAQEDKERKIAETYQKKMAAGASALEDQTPLLKRQVEALEAQLGTLSENNRQLEAMCKSLSQAALDSKKESFHTRIISFISITIAFLSLLAQILPFIF